jgi:hypothetical protein
MIPRIDAARVTVFLLAGLFGAACRSGGDGDDGTGPEVPGDPEAGDFAAMALSEELDGILQQLIMPGGAPGCVTIDPFPFIDSDQDHVPDDVRFTFDLDGCKFTMDAGNWGSISGAIRVTDAGTAFGFDALVQGLTAWYHMADHVPVWTVGRERSGTLHLTGSPAQVAFTIDQGMVLHVTGEPDATLTMKWSGTFVPAGSMPFDFVSVMPGTLTLTGTSMFTRNGSTIELSLTTPTPLRWEDSCDSPWPQSGVVRATVVSGASPGYLEVTYSACWETGEVEFIPS